MKKKRTETITKIIYKKEDKGNLKRMRKTKRKESLIIRNEVWVKKKELSGMKKTMNRRSEEDKIGKNRRGHKKLKYQCWKQRKKNGKLKKKGNRKIIPRK